MRAEGDDVQQCASAYEQAQVFRNAGQLSQAEAQLRICVRDVCPDFVKVDCGQWLSDVKREMPSVIFAAEDAAGHELTELAVAVDDKPLLTSLDGKALELDPGQHQVRFDYQGKSQVQRLIVRQGEKNRVVKVTFKTSLDSDGDGLQDADDVCPLVAGPLASRGCPAQAAVEPTNAGDALDPKLIGAVAGWGVGAIGFVGFAAWGLTANKIAARARAGCEAGGCPTQQYLDDHKQSESNYRLPANVSLGVGIVGIAAGTVLFVLHQTEQRSVVPQTAGFRFDIQPVSHGHIVSFSGTF